jgi:CGNR zinc finger
MRQTLNQRHAPEPPLWKLSIEVATLLGTERRSKVSACGNAECRWLFLDISKNHSRRWCEMKLCGNRLKVRRLSQKQGVSVLSFDSRRAIKSLVPYRRPLGRKVHFGQVAVQRSRRVPVRRVSVRTPIVPQSGLYRPEANCPQNGPDSHSAVVIPADRSVWRIRATVWRTGRPEDCRDGLLC